MKFTHPESGEVELHPKDAADIESLRNAGFAPVAIPEEKPEKKPRKKAE